MDSVIPMTNPIFPRSHRMTPLRQRMTEEMQLRNLSAGTQRAYLHYITGLARFYQTSPEHLSLEEIREYQLYMINERQYSPESVNHFVAAAKFLYNITLRHYAASRTMPRVDMRAAIHRHLDCGKAA
jgi:integrase/recombinase XerD